MLAVRSAMSGKPTTERFTGRAQHYHMGRPDYPDALLDHLFAAGALRAGMKVADLGSGTGIFSAQLLDRGLEVYGVEPNEDMIAVAAERFGPNPLFHSIQGKAEETTLPDGSVGAVLAAQAFHWFEPEASMREFERISTDGAELILVWNEREREEGFGMEYARLVEEFQRGHEGVKERREHPELMFGKREFERDEFPHSKQYDLPCLLHLIASVSSLPVPGDPRYENMAERIRMIFAEHQSGGTVTMRYRTHCCHGRI